MIDYLKANHLSLLIIAYLVFMSGGAGMFGASYDPTTFENPIIFNDTTEMNGAVALDGNVTLGNSVNDTVNLTGSTTVNNVLIASNVNSTSTTATTYTLVAADFVGYSDIFITPNTGDLTITFPASSTLTHFLPTAGDRMKQCWYNASTTAGIDITFAAGTGIDLETASSSFLGGGLPVLTLLANSTGCIDYIRKPSTASAFDILLLYTRYADGD